MAFPTNSEEPRALFYESGRKGYFIGALDGTVPQVGYHIEGKMCGLWFPPHRVLRKLRWLDASGEALNFFRFETLPVGRRVVLANADSVVTLTFLISEDALDFRVNVDTSRPLLCELELDAMHVWENEESDGASLPHSIEESSNGLILTVEGRAYTMSFSNATLLEREGERSLWKISNGGELRISKMGIHPRSFRELTIDKEKARDLRYLPTSARHWARNMLIDLLLETDGGEGIVAGFPEFPWWFGIDTYFIGLASLGLGLPRLAAVSFENVMEKIVDGRIPHEVNADGKVIFQGKALETLLQADLLLRLSEAVMTLEEAKEYFSILHRSGRNILESHLYPEGPGIVELPYLEAPNTKTLDNAVAAFVFAKSMRSLSERLGIDGLKDGYEALVRWYNANFLNDWFDPYRGIFKETINGSGTHRVVTFAQVLPLVYGLTSEDIARTVWGNLQRLDMITPRGLRHSLGSEMKRGFYADKDEKIWWLGNALLKKAAERYGLPLPEELDLLFEVDTLQRGMPGAVPEIVGLEGGCFAQAWSTLYIGSA